MSEHSSQEMVNIVRNAMKRHPTGMLVTPDNDMKTISAIQWNDKPVEKDALFALLLMNIACVAIKNGILTKTQVIDAINEGVDGGNIRVVSGENIGGFND